MYESAVRVHSYRQYAHHLSDNDRCGNKGGAMMKRVKSACIFQTLIFSQKEDCGLSKELQTKYNHEEVEKYKKALEKANTRYVITDATEQSDGSVLVKVRKHYNDKTDTGVYFEI